MKCCICGLYFIGRGNNPWPVDEDPSHECCDACNATRVVPARLALAFNNKEDNK